MGILIFILKSEKLKNIYSPQSTEIRNQRSEIRDQRSGIGVAE